jgi:hypothetical protein
MAIVVKLKEKTAFWTGKEDAVWSDDLTEAKEYDSLSDAKLAIGAEIPEYYELEAVDAGDLVVAGAEEDPAE